jgi:hypothetical protein
MKTILNTSLVTLFVLTTMLGQSVQAQTTGDIDVTGTYVADIISTHTPTLRALLSTPKSQ